MTGCRERSTTRATGAKASKVAAELATHQRSRCTRFATATITYAVTVGAGLFNPRLLAAKRVGFQNKA